MSGVEKEYAVKQSKCQTRHRFVTNLRETSSCIIKIRSLVLFPTKLPFEITTKNMLRRLIDVLDQMNRDFTNL